MKLKPCPMCGGEMRVRLWNDGYMGQYYHVVCDKCGMTTGLFNSYEQALKVWERKDNK